MRTNEQSLVITMGPARPMLGYSLHDDGWTPISNRVRITATMAPAYGLVVLQAFSLARFQLT
jgi:hypothetical protein